MTGHDTSSAAVDVPPRVLRDRMTWSLYALFAAIGWYLYVLNPSIVLVAEELGATAAVAGLHGTAGAVGAAVGGVILARVSVWLGRRSTVRAGAGVLAAGIALFTGSGAVWGTLSGALLGGIGVGLMLGIANASLSDRHGRAGGAALAEGNAISSFVSAAGPLVLGAMVAAGLGWRMPLLMVVVGLALLAFVVPVLPSEPRADTEDAAAAHLPRAYWWAWGVVVPLIAVEFCYAIWSGTLIAERTGTSVATATSALTAFVLAVGIGRVVTARIALRVTSGVLLLSSVIACAIGWTVLRAADTYSLAVVGMVISGLGVSVHVPIGTARALAAAAGHTDVAMGRLGLGFGVAIAIAPFVLGALTDSVGVVAAFWVVPAILALATLVLVAGWLVDRPLRATTT